MTTGRINQVVNYRGRGEGEPAAGATGAKRPTQPWLVRSRPFPASARKRRRVSETSESAGPMRRPDSRSSRGEAGEGHEPKLMAKLLTSTLHPKTPAHPTNRKSSVPTDPRKTARRCRLVGRAARFFPQAVRLFARQWPKGRDRRSRYPVPSWTTTRSILLL